MKLVIIESPYRGDNYRDLERNKLYLRACIRDCISRGESPYASHRMLTDALDDTDPHERATGIEAGLAWRNVRQPVFDDKIGAAILKQVSHIFYVDFGYSTGMSLSQKRYTDEEIPYEERKLRSDDPFFVQASLL